LPERNADRLEAPDVFAGRENREAFRLDRVAVIAAAARGQEDDHRSDRCDKDDRDGGSRDGDARVLERLSNTNEEILVHRGRTS
jgi:hypothetical protein